MTNKKPGNRGGARKGAGRKPRIPNTQTAVLPVRVSAKARDFFRNKIQLRKLQDYIERKAEE